MKAMKQRMLAGLLAASMLVPMAACSTSPENADQNTDTAASRLRGSR